jgi:hypothetical protein
VIDDLSFVSNRIKEVLCFVGVAKLVVQEKGLFVSSRKWRFGRRGEQRKSKDLTQRKAEDTEKNGEIFLPAAGRLRSA